MSISEKLEFLATSVCFEISAKSLLNCSFNEVFFENDDKKLEIYNSKTNDLRRYKREITQLKIHQQNNISSIETDGDNLEELLLFLTSVLSSVFIIFDFFIIFVD